MTMNSNNNGRIMAAEPEFRAAVMVARRDSAPLLLSASSQQRGDYYASLVHSNSFPPYEEESMDEAVCGRPSMMIRNNDLISNTLEVLNSTATTTSQYSKNNDTMELPTTTPWRLHRELRW